MVRCETCTGKEPNNHPWCETCMKGIGGDEARRMAEFLHGYRKAKRAAAQPQNGGEE